MKALSIIILSILVVFSVSAGGNSEAAAEISGTIEGGLRLLSVDDTSNDLEFTIYRGDYIVFDFETGGSHEFKVPDLEIDTSMPITGSEKAYVKMKESGDYNFSLGDRKGVFHVLELVDNNYHEVTAAEGLDLINNVNPLIIDVRTEGEYQQVHIPGANLLPVQVFADNIAQLEEFKNEDVFVYCASGNRSTVAARMLIDAGFTKVYNLRHGIGDWARKGNPVE